MSAHFPALQVVIPLLAAPLCVLFRDRRIAFGLALAAACSALYCAITLLLQVRTGAPISYELGGWAAPWGIEYRVDLLTGYMLVLVSSLAVVTLLFAPKSVGKEIDEDRRHFFYAAYLLALTGLLGIVITGDAFNVFVFLEIASLASYALISMGKSRRSLFAAYQYLVMGTIGSTFILISIGLIYMMTGTLNMADLAARLGGMEERRAVIAAFAFFTVGVSVKMALFPLHKWLPNAYAYAPSVVSAFIAATSTKVSVYILVRFWFSVFGGHIAIEEGPVVTMLMILALVGILAGSSVALFQSNVKRMLAYSSVAQIGYIVLGLSLVSLNGLTGGLVHLFNHALMKGGLFLAVGCVAFRIGSVQIEAFHGLGKRMPVTSFLFVLGGLSLIGVPLTVGFISKWYLVMAALERGLWVVAALILAASLLALGYIWRIVEAAYFRPPPEGAEREEAPLALLIPTGALIAASIVFGITTDATAGVAREAAAFLFGSLP